MPKLPDDIKIIPTLPQEPKIPEGKEWSFLLIPLLFFVCFLVLFILVVYLPAPFSLKVLGLLIGSFILEDIFRSLKLFKR